MDSQSKSSASKGRDDKPSSQQGIVSSASKLLSGLTDSGNPSSSSSSSSSASFLKNTLSDLVNSSDKTRSAGQSSSSSSSRQTSTWAESSSSSGSRATINRPDLSSFRSNEGNTATAGGDLESSFQSFKTSSFSELFSPPQRAGNELFEITSAHPPSADCQEAALRDGEEVLHLLNDPSVELMSESDVLTASSLLEEEPTIPGDPYAEEIAEDPVEWLNLTGKDGEYTEMVWGNKPAQRKVNDPELEEEDEEELEEPEPAPPPKPDLKGKGKAVDRTKVYMKSHL